MSKLQANHRPVVHYSGRGRGGVDSSPASIRVTAERGRWSGLAPTRSTCTTSAGCQDVNALTEYFPFCDVRPILVPSL